MNILPSNRIRDHIQNLIHEDTQLHEKRIDLTADKICRFIQPGSLDFGGSEFKPASVQVITPKKKETNDKYGWWELTPGQYKVFFNEKISLEEDILAMISLHDHGRQAGLIANTAMLMNSDEVSLSFNISEIECQIKENARIATAAIVQI